MSKSDLKPNESSQPTRRQLLRSVGALGAAGLLGTSTMGCSGSGKGLTAAPIRGASDKNSAVQGTNIYFGDFHNHTECGYARGSLKRSFKIARSHLDFFACTPHGWWHDIGTYENNIERKWLNGFKIVQRQYPEVIKLVTEFNMPGKFVAIAGFEWHSTNCGDYHILFPNTKDAEYTRCKTLKEFQKFAKSKGALLVPHHPANKIGHRGTDISLRDPEVSPVLEMFSEWGNAEHDRAPSPYVRHTEGSRWTQNTLQHYLKNGHRMGVVASTDDHLGFPGGYREGLAAIIADELTPEAIFDALRNRRCYAVSGDRIKMSFHCNGEMMGQELDYTRKRKLAINVEGWDQVDRVELLKNNRVIARNFPMDREPGADCWKEPVIFRFEYGWGPWPALDMTRVCDWDFEIFFEGGTILEALPCFQSGPLEENRLDEVVKQTKTGVHIRSFTALRQQFEDISTKAMVMKLNASPKTKVTIRTKTPTKMTLTKTFAELAKSNDMFFTGDFPKESAMLHRLTFADHWRTSFTVDDTGDGKQDDWYYVRVVQANEQYAWSSPIWVNRRKK